MPKIFLPHLPEDSFTWSRWRAFSLFSLMGIACRTGDIIYKGLELQRFAVGWIEGERLVCRPKGNVIAVMWLEEDFTWCHLTLEEFDRLFWRK